MKYDDDGLVAAIVQEEGTGEVLMMAWMNAETLRMSLDQGRTVFWSRSRQEVWRKGDTSGDRQFVREAYYDCDGDTLLFVVEQEGKGACHTGDVLLLLPLLRRSIRRRGNRALSTRWSTRRATSSAALAAIHTVVPVWRELLADLTTPVAAFARLVGDEPGFLLESVEQRAMEPLVVRRPQPARHDRLAGRAARGRR